MFIPWQADDATREEAFTEARRMKEQGSLNHYVVVDPMGQGQVEI